MATPARKPPQPAAENPRTTPQKSPVETRRPTRHFAACALSRLILDSPRTMRPRPISEVTIKVPWERLSPGREESTSTSSMSIREAVVSTNR